MVFPILISVWYSEVKLKLGDDESQKLIDRWALFIWSAPEISLGVNQPIDNRKVEKERVYAEYTTETILSSLHSLFAGTESRETQLSNIYTNENSLSFILHRKIEWSVLSIYFYEVQNDKTLLLTLWHNKSIKDMQWNKWNIKVQQKIWKRILFTACCHPLELTSAGDY